MNSKKPEVDTTETNTTEQVQNAIPTTFSSDPIVNDSLKQIALQNQLGAFAHSGIYGTAGETVIENDLLQLTVNNKGGYITKALLKSFKTHKATPLYLINDNSASFNLNFGTLDNRTLN